MHAFTHHFHFPSTRHNNDNNNDINAYIQHHIFYIYYKYVYVYNICENVNINCVRYFGDYEINVAAFVCVPLSLCVCV